MISMYINEEGLDFRDPYDREIILQQRREELAERLREKKERNKTYLKGQRGVRRYYDYDIPVCEDKDGNEIRKIKCVYTRDKRRKSLFKYLKYLKGRKVLVRDLAWKYAVTERTIQSDLKYLIDKGFIERQTNKTYLNRQTKNSYIVHPEKEKDLPFSGDSYVMPIIVAKQDDKYFVVTSTDYTESEMKKGLKDIKYFTFTLPMHKMSKLNKIDEYSIALAKQIFGGDVQASYYGLIYEHYSKGKDVDETTKKVYERWEEKAYFTFMELDELYPPREKYKWITLKVAPRRIGEFHANKGIHHVMKILGVK